MAEQKDPDVLVTKNYQLTGRLSAPEHFVEGASQIFFGYPMTKLVLHSMVIPKNGQNPEIRRTAQYLTMPTVNAIELANLILTAAKSVEGQLLADLNPSSQKKVKEVLTNFQPKETKEIEFDAPQVAPEASSSQRRIRLTKKRT